MAGTERCQGVVIRIHDTATAYVDDQSFEWLFAESGQSLSRRNSVCFCSAVPDMGLKHLWLCPNANGGKEKVWAS